MSALRRQRALERRRQRYRERRADETTAEKGEGCRVGENGEGGDSWVRRLSLLLKVVRGFEKMTRTREDLRRASH